MKPLARGVLRVPTRALIAALLALAAGCATGAPPATTTPAVPSLVETKRQVGEYVASGRYTADIAAVTAEAREYLSRRLGRGGRLAIVLDVDETTLSNLPALRANDYGFILGGPCDTTRAVRLHRMARVLPGGADPSGAGAGDVRPAARRRRVLHHRPSRAFPNGN